MTVKKKKRVFKKFKLGVCANSGVPAQKGPLAQVSREFFFFFFTRLLPTSF